MSPEAVALAVHALECMMADLDAGVIQLMRERGAELAIIGRHQVRGHVDATLSSLCIGINRTSDVGRKA